MTDNHMWVQYACHTVADMLHPQFTGSIVLDKCYKDRVYFCNNGRQLCIVSARTSNLKSKRTEPVGFLPGRICETSHQVRRSGLFCVVRKRTALFVVLEGDCMTIRRQAQQSAETQVFQEDLEADPEQYNATYDLY